MYTHFYGLREKPFSLSPDPRYLFLSDSHREALAHLLYGIEQGEGFIAITGEVGTGKTTLSRTLLQRVEPGTEIAFLFNPQISGLELLQAINAELGLESEGLSRRELNDQLNRFLLAKKAEGRRVLLLLDEAQNLEPDALEQVRLLSNLETDTSKLLQIILIGQPELDAMLESPHLRQLRQRITVRWKLRPLSLSDTREYVRHRLRISAGASRELFSDLALREIHRRSGGVPRLINLICDRALLAGYAAGAHTVGLALVAQTQQELEGDAREGHPRPRSGLRRSMRLAGWLGAGVVLVALGVGLGFAARQLAGQDAAPSAADAASGLPEAATAAGSGAARPGFEAGAEVGTNAPGIQAPAAPPSAAGADEARRAGGLASARPGEAASRTAATDAVPGAGVGAAAAAENDPAPHPSPAGASPPELGADLSPTLPEDLSVALARRAPGVTAARALDALLEAWGQPPQRAGILARSQVLEALRAAGLRAEPIEIPSLEAALAWDLPLLLELRAADEQPRAVAMLGVEAGGARLAGVARTDPVALGELAQALGGRAWVVWRDLGELPPVLRPGVESEATDWLQGALAVLGLWSGPATGRYDAETIAAVRRFQAREGLVVDGTVGPRTKLRLYARLPTYELPRLGAFELAEAPR